MVFKKGMLGKHHSKESIEKMAAKKRGVKQTKEHIAKRTLDNSGLFKKGHKINLGKEYSIERINKARLSRLNKSGWEKSKEQIEQQIISLNKYYKNHPEARERIREERKEYIKLHPEEKVRLKKMRDNIILPVKDTKIEVKIQNYLKQLGIEYLTHQHMNINHSYQCDILIPSMNMVIECDGDYWHKYPIGNDIDHVRTSELLEKGFKVLRLWEFEIKEMDVNGFKQKIMELK